jgi:dCTP deaminase
MILTRDVILREIAAGRLIIDPLRPEQVGPASVDLHLGDEIRVMTGAPEPIAVTEEADYRAVTRVERLEGPYLLRPGETIHAITRERIVLPPDIGGWLEGRSRYGRFKVQESL